MSEPLVYADQWRAVMERAAYRCQCTGECGNVHAKGNQCRRRHDTPGSRWSRPVRLLAAPADPTISPVSASRLPSSQLSAWCPNCHDLAHNTSATTPDQDELFAL